MADYESKHDPNRTSGIKCQSGSKIWIVLLLIWLNFVKLSAKCGKQFWREGWGPSTLTKSMPHRVRAVLASRRGTGAISNSITLVVICTMGLGDLAFNLFCSNGYGNTGYVVVKCWFSRALRETYITWAGGERNLNVLDTSEANICTV